MAGTAGRKVPANSGLDVTGIHGRCHYYLPRKKRVCRLMAASGKQFCGEHLIFEEELVKLSDQGRETVFEQGTFPGSRKLGHRLWCPLDPRHTVDEYDLERHLRRCNARPKSKPDYMVVDLHADSPATRPIRECFETPHLTEVSDVTISHILQFLNSHQIHLKQYCNGPIEISSQDHDANVGKKQGKHPAQYASLLKCLQDANLLLRESVLVEVGAGKGNSNACW